MIIENNSGSIKKYLEKTYKEVAEVRHLGNFVFEVNTNLGTIKVVTEPVNENEIKILLVK